MCCRWRSLIVVRRARDDAGGRVLQPQARSTARRWSPRSNDRDAAGLMGINTGLVITFSYALSSLTAAFAGVLIAPLTLTGATMGAVLGLKAFAVAIIGGLTSGMGVVVGGLILGIAETTTGFYISHRLQGRAGPRAAADRAGGETRRACSARPPSRRSERMNASRQPPRWPLLARRACCCSRWPSPTRTTSTCSRRS